MFKHILFATDGSPASANAARLAVGLARTHGAALTALYVVDPYPYLGVGEANPLGFQAYMSAAMQHASSAHTDVAQLAAEEPPVDVHVRTAEDIGASTGITQTAREIGADLIVVGSHGRTGISRLMLGSVAARVVAESPVPVLVAR
ncbi:MAG: universal stress protein [Burkholderiales bacterium]|nr:universal stress protein [Burkholderiales bacterium]